MGGLLIASSALRRLLFAACSTARARVHGVASTAPGVPRVRHRRDSPHKSHRWHGEELSVEQQIKNHIARESFGLGEVQIKPGAKKGDAGGAAGWVEKAELLAA